jgi:hypothetical protein
MRTGDQVIVRQLHAQTQTGLSKRFFVCAVNSLQVLMAVFYCIFAIFFDRYEMRNVGVGVTYAAYLILSVVICQIANVVFWGAVRKMPSEVRFLRNTALVSLFVSIVFVWLGQRYSYWGSMHIG